VVDGDLDPHCGLVPGNQRLTAEQQRGTERAYFTGFFHTYLGGESDFLAPFTGDAPPPLSAITEQISVSDHPVGDPLIRRDVNRLLDVSGYFAFQFRASVNFLDSRNPSEVPQDFSVTLTDDVANSATALVSDWSAALFYPPGQMPPLSPERPLLPVAKIVLNTVRIPPSAFRAATGRMAVALTDIRTVRFDFDQQPAGVLLIADIAFADAVDP
jgi:hypothetical protein